MQHESHEASGTQTRVLAHQWLRQSEHSALAGNLADAQALLLQVWDLTHEREPRFANAAAWHLAWLLLQAQSYAEAAEWFQRIAVPMADEGLLWDTARQAQVRVCQMLATTAMLDQPALAVGDRREAEAPATFAPLAVTSLGSFSIARGGQVLVHCKSRKSIGLFRYLLLRRNHEATREELIEIFWPEAPPDKALHSLHMAVKALRQYLDIQASYIVFDQGSYFVHPGAPISDDRSLFFESCATGDRHWAAGQHTAAQRAYEQATAAYRGDYHIDNYDYVWALTEQEHLLSKYLTALARLGEIYFEQRAYEQAMSYFQRLLQRDEYREDIHGQVMRCCLQLGRRHDAILQYQRCALTLKRDLGVEPMQETQAIYHEIVTSH